MTKNTAELSELLMQHVYFQQDPGKSMTRLQVSAILNAHLHRKGAYHVDRSELERAITILLSDEYQYADPISILSDIKTFSYGICQLEDTGFKKKKVQEHTHQESWHVYHEWKRQHRQRYANDPVYRANVKAHREKYGAARKNDRGEWEIYDESYHKCWCKMVNGRLQPIE